MGYRIRRTDANQRSLVERFRSLGAKVLVLSEVGKGCPDALVGVSGKNKDTLFLVEFKDGEKYPSQQKLTPDEQKFHNEWSNFVYIISDELEVDALVAWLMSQ